MSEENMTMDDFSKAVDDSFNSFKDEDQMAWENLKQLKEAKTILDVTVDGIVNKGVVSYVEGVRGFIPASKLALGRIDDLNEYLGKEIQVQVFDIDEEKNRLILSCREILRAKADEEKKAKISAIAVGSVMEGTVESIQPYGAFINLGDHLSGLVHISQISHTRIKDPSVVLSIGDSVKVKVIAIKEGKLSLSIKALVEDAEKAEQAEIDNIKIPESEELTTNLGSLFKNLKL
ncbi:MAG TPA: S1 RNA-binding domain-containing protein [Candidatus Pelethocola excrementipullorum]|nr:S1 RNA-binding domain-containing protein [Candidatus Pelethocola excrementipullorum]